VVNTDEFIRAPLPGPEKIDCPDGCGKFGRAIKSRSGHVRGCPCKPCLGGRNSKGGKARHRRFAKRAGLDVGRFNTSQEEAWRDPFRWEVKSGAQIGPVLTAWRKARDQSELTRPIGDPRPFAFGVEPLSASEPALVVLEAEVWRDLIVPLLRESM
jgi:hypothetical protein